MIEETFKKEKIIYRGAKSLFPLFLSEILSPTLIAMLFAYCKYCRGF